ncbi:beta-glucosidase [bacterium A37T11]|nr:beta-glucosidase [bacterium A37T11]
MHPWVDSVFNKLTARERVAQLFLIRAQSNLGQRYIDSIGNIIAKEQLGGIVLFQGGPVSQARLNNQYQQLVKVPLLVAIDGEWGLGMRMPDSSISYPYQMTLGAIQDDDLIYRMGHEIAKDFKRMGLHINFAPVVDINNNPRNPVINYRSFGENKENVTRKGMAYMRGMMDEGIIISLKHFPGHGDTDVDSHYDLPQLTFTRERLDSLEMLPFRTLINAGASGVMVAHMNIPALDNTPNLPSSLSKKIVSGILKDELGFKGLVFTDAMDMNGVVKYFRNGEADVRALMAGNDLLELSQNSTRAINMVLKAISDKRLAQKEIDFSVKKVLAAKYWLHLDQQKPINLSMLSSDINRSTAKVLNQQLANAAITLLKSDSMLNALNFSKNTAIVAIGTEQVSEFQKILNKHFDNKLDFLLSAQASADDVVHVANELKSYEQIIIALFDNRSKPQSILNYNATVRLFINELANRPSIFCLFANPYTLAGLPGIETAKTILIGYQNNPVMQKAAANVILKQISPSGKLPVTINSYFRYGDGKTGR